MKKSKGAKRRQRQRAGQGGITRTSAPVSMGVRFRERAARISGDGHVMVVRHRELVSDVSGSTGYAVTRYAVNPGQSSTFPWLSVLARNFEKYRFRQLRFEFESSQPTTAQGMTMLAFDLDASDPSPDSKLQLMSYQGASRAGVWAPQGTTLPEQQPPLYVRVGTQPVNTDIKTYDCANLFFATSGESAVSVIGELYVEYEVELHVPQLVGPVSTGSLRLIGGASLVGATPVGSLEYEIVNASHVAVRLVQGQTYQVTFVATTATAVTPLVTVAVPVISGQAATLQLVLTGERTTLTGEASYSTLMTVGSLTDGTYALGAGWIEIRTNYTAVTPTALNLYIVPSEALPTPVLRRAYDDSVLDRMMARLALLEARLQDDDRDDGLDEVDCDSEEEFNDGDVVVDA